MSTTICASCGNYMDVCICGFTEREDEQGTIKVHSEIRKYSKVTLILTFPNKFCNSIKNMLLGKLMKGLNTGGTFKNNQIEVRTSDIVKLKRICEQNGYKIKEVKAD